LIGRTREAPQKFATLFSGLNPPLHRLFLEPRETLRPRAEYLELFRAIVLDEWRVRCSEASVLPAALEGKLAELRGREERLEEAFLYAIKIDRTTHERQRDAIREQVALATIDLGDARAEETPSALALPRRTATARRNVWNRRNVHGVRAVTRNRSGRIGGGVPNGIRD